MRLLVWGLGCACFSQDATTARICGARVTVGLSLLSDWPLRLIGSICSGDAPDDVVLLHEFVPAVQASLHTSAGSEPALVEPVIEAVFLLLKAIADSASGSAFRNVGGVPIAMARTHTRQICIGTGACPLLHPSVGLRLLSRCPQLSWDWAHPWPHLRQDWAHPWPHLRQDWAHPWPHLRQDWARP